MSTRPFRFIHAGDFHLEQPLVGVAEVPEHLRDIFLDAPYAAAEAVFSAAVAEDAAFLVLSGNLLRPSTAGPRGPRFLVEQFSRLADREIPVYWAGGEADPVEAWPVSLPLPPSVHVFPHGRPTDAAIQRDGVPLARLVGAARDRQRALRPSEFSPDIGGLYSIAVANSEADAAGCQARAFHYWALGGRPDRTTLAGTPRPIVYCGSPQGRRPQESGPHGCTLAQVDEQGQTRTTLIPTDAARWLNERIAIDAATSRDDLATKLRERAQALGEAAPATHLLVSWTIAGQGPLIAQLRRGRLGGELLQALRDEFGHRSPATWSVSLDAELAETLPPEWYEQETIRGDFLRAVRQLQMNPDAPVELDAYLSEQHRAGTLAAAVALAGKSAREGVLREVAALGVDLLGGEEAQA